MKVWILLLWLLMLKYPPSRFLQHEFLTKLCAMFCITGSDARCPTGDIKLVGIVDHNHLAGRMELCDETGQWRSVCAGSWDKEDARVACRQMGYSDQGAFNPMTSS